LAKVGGGASDCDLVEKGETSSFIAAEFERKENLRLEIRLFINPQTGRVQKKYLKKRFGRQQAKISRVIF